ERQGLILTPWRVNIAPPPTVLDIDLSLARGETLALVGESGSGKSTIARSIAGLQSWLDGDVRFGDSSLAMDVVRRPPELRQAIQLVFQNPDASLNPRQTVAQILDRPLHLFHGLRPAARRERAAHLLEQVRLSPEHLKRFPGQLSGGEKQRVAIARAFAADPVIVLCDEVVSALDVSVQAAVLNLLARLQRSEGTAYLFISHDLAVVRAIADRVAILYLGRMCELGPTVRVFEPPYHPYTETLLGAALEPEPGFRPRLLANDVVDSGPPPRGCPFQKRCPHRLGSVCEQETPPWRLAGDGHAIRCHIPLNELQSRQRHIAVEQSRGELATAGA
ncbi:MAG: ABC transporter ATP-binding protein, partial [Thermomicrobiales bacterium]|nr:ABC transporter ATP-binding protein [Thermomicrobiales bacterium]